MDSPPEDILRLIFDSYVHDFGLSPASLLRICRRWYDLLISTRSLWTRVVIHINSLDTVDTICRPNIDEKHVAPASRRRWSRLHAYLDRSLSHNNDKILPLDIIIKWSRISVYMGGRQCCQIMERLLLALAGVSWFISSGKKKFTHGVESKMEFGISKRWRALKIDFTRVSAKNTLHIFNLDVLRQHGIEELPLLESISMVRARYTIGAIRLPRLRRLSLDHCDHNLLTIYSWGHKYHISLERDDSSVGRNVSFPDIQRGCLPLVFRNFDPSSLSISIRGEARGGHIHVISRFFQGFTVGCIVLPSSLLEEVAQWLELGGWPQCRNIKLRRGLEAIDVTEGNVRRFLDALGDKDVDVTALDAQMESILFQARNNRVPINYIV